MQRKRAFTLVEMLVVIVIVAILMSALISRLTWYLAKARDMKRYTDLRTIATAIEVYKADHGGIMPVRIMTEQERENAIPNRREHHLFWGHASALYEALKNYINEIPKDPLKKSFITIHRHAINVQNMPTGQWWFGKNLEWGTMYKPWEYFYQILLNKPAKTKKQNTVDGVGVLIAKVETPKVANYVLSVPEREDTKGWARPNIAAWLYGSDGQIFISPVFEIKDIALCSYVEKADKWESATYPIMDGQPCKYTSEDQLYYVLKIE